MNKIPQGATHIHHFYGNDYYYRWDEDRRNSLTGDMMFCWHSLSNGKWVKDTSICNRNFTRI
jgi:hypothetical protein